MASLVGAACQASGPAAALVADAGFGGFDFLWTLSRAGAAEFYEARWGIELNCSARKQTLGRRRVLAKTPTPGALKLAANILASALLFYHAALAMGARVGRLSVSADLKTLRRAMEAVRLGAPTGWFLKRRRAALRDSYRRRSRKRARDWPHKKKDPPPPPPRWRNPTPRQNALIQVCSLYHELGLG